MLDTVPASTRTAGSTPAGVASRISTTAPPGPPLMSQPTLGRTPSTACSWPHFSIPQPLNNIPASFVAADGPFGTKRGPGRCLRRASFARSLKRVAGVGMRRSPLFQWQ